MFGQVAVSWTLDPSESMLGATEAFSSRPPDCCKELAKRSCDFTSQTNAQPFSVDLKLLAEKVTQRCVPGNTFVRGE